MYNYHVSTEVDCKYICFAIFCYCCSRLVYWTGRLLVLLFSVHAPFAIYARYLHRSVNFYSIFEHDYALRRVIGNAEWSAGKQKGICANGVIKTPDTMFVTLFFVLLPFRY